MDALKRKISLTLPYPPSANRYWRKTRTGRVYVSDEAKTFKQEVGYCAGGQSGGPMMGDIRLVIDIYRPRKSGDLSNRIKILEDALNGLAYHDDSQVTEIVARRFDDKQNPRVEIEITQI